MPSIDHEGWAKRLSRELSAAWVIARKDMRIYYLKPNIIVSGVFIPISAMPQIGQDIALISPLTYGNDMIEYAYTGTSLFSPLLDIVVLLIFILIFQIAANRLYKKFNE